MLAFENELTILQGNWTNTIRYIYYDISHIANVYNIFVKILISSILLY